MARSTYVYIVIGTYDFGTIERPEVLGAYTVKWEMERDLARDRWAAYRLQVWRFHDGCAEHKGELLEVFK